MRVSSVCPLCLALVLMLWSAADAWAHGGRLDTDGCHHHRTQEEYHCHRGPLKGDTFPTKDAMLKVLEDEAEVNTPDASAGPSSEGPEQETPKPSS